MTKASVTVAVTESGSKVQARITFPPSWATRTAMGLMHMAAARAHACSGPGERWVIYVDNGLDIVGKGATAGTLTIELSEDDTDEKDRAVQTMLSVQEVFNGATENDGAVRDALGTRIRW